MTKQMWKTYGPMYIVLAAILWGIDGVLRRSLYSLAPSIIVFYEHLIGAIIIAPATIIALQKEKVTRREWLVLLVIAMLSGVAGTLMFTAALVKVNFISISVVFLLQKLQPIFAIAAAVLLLKEKIDRRYIGWAVLAFISAYFVTFKNGQINLATGAGTVTAALLAVGAAFAWGSSTALSRITVLKLSNTLATGLRFFITVPLALLTVYLLKDSAGLLAIDTSQMVRFIVIALSTGMVALWIYYKGLQHTEVRVATFLELVFPLTGVLIDVFYYHNVLATTQYLAAVVLLFAVYRLSLLNQAVVYTSEVESGFSRGKNIGFPTLNLIIPEKFKFKHGIYAARVWIKGKAVPAALHFGPVPTYNNKKPSLEVFLLDSIPDKELKTVNFEISQYLRDIKKFDDPKKLSAQIAEDVARIKALPENVLVAD